jgi:hypothetical protein
VAAAISFLFIPLKEVEIEANVSSLSLTTAPLSIVMSLQDINQALLHPSKIVNPAELDFANVSTNTILQLRKVQEDLEASRAENKRLNAKVESLKAEKARQIKLLATELEESTSMMQALMNRHLELDEAAAKLIESGEGWKNRAEKWMSRARRLREAFEELGTVLGYQGVLRIGDAPQVIANFLGSRGLV